MKIVCFSSFTFAYLDRARVLFSTIGKYHPDWKRIALITDRPPTGFTFNPRNEPFDLVIYADDLPIPEFESWLFGHDVVEACTAVKGPFMEYACSSGADAIVYLDPDTALLAPLDPVHDLLRDWDIILTPHQLEPDADRQTIIDNEITSLKTGIYNLGFTAIRTGGEGRRFASWWRDRLLMFCHDDIPNGLFVDQRWCDHVPALFEKVKILRDPGYNVASWNLSNRRLRIGTDGAITVNGSPLRFWHFTKLGPTGDVMTKRYAKDNFEVYEIWNWYRRQIKMNVAQGVPPRYWAYNTYEDGTPIKRHHRLLYRSRPDLRAQFPDPFKSGRGSFGEWILNEDMSTGLAV